MNFFSFDHLDIDAAFFFTVIVLLSDHYLMFKDHWNYFVWKKNFFYYWNLLWWIYTSAIQIEAYFKIIPKSQIINDYFQNHFQQNFETSKTKRKRKRKKKKL